MATLVLLAVVAFIVAPFVRDLLVIWKA